jgi:hypothetical protein
VAGADAFRRSITAFIDGNLSQEARGRALAHLAETTVTDLIAQGRASPRFRRFTDGVEGAPPEKVRRGGNILYEFSYVGEAVVYALEFLRARSPVGPGAPKDRRYPRAYRDCFMVSVNGGHPIQWDSVVADRIPPGATVYIYNSQPYSRLIDSGWAGKTRVRFNKPWGVFDDTVRWVRRRFGNTLTARRMYNVDFPGKYVTRTRGPVQSPAIVLTPV